MRFGLLGETTIEREDVAVTIAAPRQRALLALLLLHRGAPVPAERLAVELWGDQLPATPIKTVQVYVAQLRKQLGAGVVDTRDRSYVVDLDRHELDLVEFERLAAQGRDLLTSSELDAASARTRDALSLWRGPPLADFTYEEFAQAEIARLLELRLATLEVRFDADLRLGRHLEAVGELEALVRAEPDRERLVSLLMLALYRSGRQAAALEAYQEARRALTERLGIEPGRPLRELERAILNQDPSLDPSTSARVVAAPPRTKTGFVGREAELGALLDGLGDAIDGRGRLFLLVGEPGIGKSRLAEELVGEAGARGADVLSGRCWEAGGAPAFWPWVQALRGYVRSADRERLELQLGGAGGDLGHLVPELRQLFPDLPEPQALESEGARFRLFDAATTFLRNVSSDRPLVLVLDDLHAADEPSLLLLRFLAREIGSSSILLVAALRDVDPLPNQAVKELLAEVARDPTSERITLAGLDESAVAEFLAGKASELAVPEIVHALHEETEGNPLFVSEMVQLLAVEGSLREASEAKVAIPQSVREVIDRRLAHLSDECNRVLVLASVLGREFALPVLTTVAAVPGEALLETLDEAMSARIVVEVPDEPERLRFAHVLIRDALYEGLTSARRIQLHRLAVAGIEAAHRDADGPYLTELAHHAIAGHEFAKALDYAGRAGDRAAGLLAYEEAERLYELGLGLLEAERIGGEADRCELLLRLGDVQARAGDAPAAKDSFLRAAGVARASGMPEHLARAALGYGGRFVWTRPWGDDLLVPLLEEALAALPEGAGELRVRLLARLAGGALRDTLPVGPRVAMAQQALDLARPLGDPATLAYALSGRHCANWGPDALAERIALAEELVAVADGAGDRERAYEGLDFRYQARLERGDARGAYADLEAKTRLAEDLRQPAQLWDVAVDRAQFALLEGRFEDADVAIREALELGRSAQSANAQVGFELQTYALNRQLGRLERSLPAVERAVESYPAYPIWRYVRADVYAQLDRKEEARAALDRLAEQSFPVRVEMQWLLSISLLAEVCRYLADAERAATLYALLAPYAQLNAVTPPELNWGSVSRNLGLLAATMSSWSMATKHFEDAVELNAAMGARPWLAHTQDDYARMLLERGSPGDPERAEQLFDQAIAIYRELGMESYAARALRARGVTVE